MKAPESKVVRFELEHEDGSVWRLTGEGAEKHTAVLNHLCAWAITYGATGGEDPPWEILRSSTPGTTPDSHRAAASRVWNAIREVKIQTRSSPFSSTGEQSVREAVAHGLGVPLDCVRCGGTGLSDGGRWPCSGCNTSGVALAVTCVQSDRRPAAPTTETGTRDLEALAAEWEREAKRCEDDIKDAPHRDQEVHFATMAMLNEAHAKTLRAALLSRGDANGEHSPWCRRSLCDHGMRCPEQQRRVAALPVSRGDATAEAGPGWTDVADVYGLARSAVSPPEHRPTAKAIECASPSPGSETPRGAEACEHDFGVNAFCRKCSAPHPDLHLPGDNHAEKEE